ncbi:MAG: MmcQ/YjbR family DNA-binding protein [Leptolyngbyaceae cyanobacterium bins.302]|nr:MmcQ/YjbR family DNA-binding protein [Leptolyngbyaceae cyanobacterium bins.302]
MTRDEFNDFCSSLPATHHVVQWRGSDVWKVGDKVFAICDRNDDPMPGITFKTSEADYELLREMPGLRPAPYLASRGMKWIQRYDHSDLSDDNLRCCIAESYNLVASSFSRRKRFELGL